MRTLLLVFLLAAPASGSGSAPAPSIEECLLRVDAAPPAASFRLECRLRLDGAREIPLRWLAFEGTRVERESLVVEVEGEATLAEWRDPTEDSSAVPDAAGRASWLVVPLDEHSATAVVRLRVEGTLEGAIRGSGDRFSATLPILAPPWPVQGGTAAFQLEVNLPPELQIVDAFPAELARDPRGEPARARLPALPALLRFTTASAPRSVVARGLARVRTRAGVTDLALALTLVGIGLGAWIRVGRHEAGPAQRPES